jgi:hypothetical protein
MKRSDHLSPLKTAKWGNVIRTANATPD